MHYFAPERLCLANGLPCFIWQQAICEPSLRLLAEGGYEISLMLGTPTAHWHSIMVAGDSELLEWLSAYRADPEACVRTTWPDFEQAPRLQAPKSPVRRELSISDLL